ncbi:hypothetical protein F5148DRAFT_1288636 [Russula earlei]|uniref:Uncharacterized protein n=1 Tax=Russula earlei TaxID=71964 RepID=A0ACC0TZR8_9AGAM|nr:hypothetical protein F5148DRAFT_1288636 [Russula earlei]
MHFWCQVVCHCILPLYCHPALVSNIKATDIEHPDPNEGSITDGDDHVWMGNPDMLVEGQWQEFDLEGMLGKWQHSVMSMSTEELSSLAKCNMEEVQGLLNDGDESDLEEGLQIKINALSIQADELVEAAEIIQSELPHKNKIWINSIMSQDIGADVSHLVKDVQHNTMGYQIQGKSLDPDDDI